MKITDWLSFEAVPQISSEKLNSQLHDGVHNLFLLDVRSHIEWKLSHIPGSHSISVLSVDISQIPKDSTIICICLTAHRSTPIVRNLLRHGFNAYELTGGMRQWWKHHYPTNNHT